MFVTRDRYNEMRARYEEAMTWNRTLVQTIVDLKRDGFTKAPKAEPRTQQPGPLDLEEIGRAGAMNEAIERMTADFTRNGADPEHAAREARKLIGEMHAVYDLD